MSELLNPNNPDDLTSAIKDLMTDGPNAYPTCSYAACVPEREGPRTTTDVFGMIEFETIMNRSGASAEQRLTFLQNTQAAFDAVLPDMRLDDITADFDICQDTILFVGSRRPKAGWNFIMQTLSHLQDLQPVSEKEAIAIEHNMINCMNVLDNYTTPDEPYTPDNNPKDYNDLQRQKAALSYTATAEERANFYKLLEEIILDAKLFNTNLSDYVRQVAHEDLIRSKLLFGVENVGVWPNEIGAAFAQTSIETAVSVLRNVSGYKENDKIDTVITFFAGAHSGLAEKLAPIMPPSKFSWDKKSDFLDKLGGRFNNWDKSHLTGAYAQKLEG